MADDATTQATTELAVLIPTIIYPVAERTARASTAFRSPVIREISFTGPGGTLDLTTIGTVSAAAYPDEGAARTFSTDTPTKISPAPDEIDVAMKFSDKAIRRTILATPDMYAMELGRGVAVKIDSDCAALYGQYTANQVDGGAALAASEIINAIGNIRVDMQDMAGPITAVLHTAEWANVITDSAVYSADVRGSGNALFSGEIMLLGGERIVFTTAINSVGTTPEYMHMVLGQRAMVNVYKTLFQFEAWRDQNSKTNRIAAGADYAVSQWFTDEGALLKSDV